MTTCPLSVRLACLTASCAALFSTSGCGSDSPPREEATWTAETPHCPAAGLTVCPDPDLASLDRAASPTMLPVAYPAAELDRPARLARSFPLASPQMPSASALTPPIVTELPPALPLAPQPPAPGPQLLPPGEQLAPPERLPATAKQSAPQASLTSQTGQARPTATAGAADQRMGPPAARPVAPRRAPRSRAMQAVNQQAERLIRHGYYLGQRGALYSARAEFIQALRTVSQALDVEFATREHTQALSAGLTALEEAEDFVPEGSRLETDLDVPGLISVHRTPACKAIDAADLLPVVVVQHYYTYAQQQLAVAAGGEEAASMALFGLGKTYITLAVEKTLSAPVAEPKAMVFHWAALAADPGNFLAANELAVLYARWGDYATARSLLQHSIAVLPHSAVWRNLAVVHQRLGEAKLAELAQREAEVAGKREASAPPDNPRGIVASSDVQWLDAKEFASTSRTEVDAQKPAAPSGAAGGVKAKPVVAPAPPRRRSAAAWFPWLR
ncbi:MAG TPA: hypothetical protein VNH11_15920 [Pirellulales bacterium]|nr:hypothetical protein [Pirellulales bacterium]